MQLEQTLEMYGSIQTQRAMPEQRQRNYTIVDLESLSASALYMPGEIENGAMNWVGNLPTIGRSSWTRSTDYIKSIPQGELHVHAPNGIVTGANLNKEPISNYEAAMLDLQRGKVHKNTGNF